MPFPYKVLVVDDSSFMRKFISDLLAQDTSLEVIGTAVDGAEALQKIRELKPDVITLDIEMPRMDGLTALKEIMRLFPTPVVMLSNFTQAGADATLQALEIGAFDFVAKPSGTISLDLNIVADEIIEKVKAAAQSIPVAISRVEKPKINHGEKMPINNATLKNIVAIGTSTGGPRALHTIVSELPGDIEASVLIVQHMPKEFTRSLAERLNNVSALTVKEAENGDELLPGKAFLAPGGYHLTIKQIDGKHIVSLNEEEPANGHRPSVDIMMKSAASSGLFVLGVLLTGMGCDGAEGMEKIKDVNGLTIAEDASTSVIFGMPKVAIERNAVDYVLPLTKIASKITEIIKKRSL